MELATETHQNGPWKDWGLEWKTDRHGRAYALSISGPGISRTFTYGHDDFSRLNKSSSLNHSASYMRNADGQLSSLRRGRVVTAWGYDGNNGRLTGVSNVNASGTNYGYAYPEVDARLRIRRRVASVGASWRQLIYDDFDQLRSANVTNAGAFSYEYDSRGNRNGQGPSVVDAHNGLDQFTSRTLLARGFGIFGAVRRDASLLAFHPLANVAGDAVGVDPLTGNFFSWWNVPSNHNNGLASRMDTLVRATAPNPTGPPPVSESTVFLTVPPNLESATYDFAGRMASDAYWVYGWNAQGRMTDMTRKDPTLVGPNVLRERLDFIHDADGRRTLKTRTVTYPQNKIEIEESQVLWAKWLPVYEIRRKNGAVSSRRWFQWGVDLSGTLDGAGGIGGLVAIIEENAAGAHTRTLLPVQDGLGNVTAVIDALTGSTVARYDYGPFGEPLGVTGDADACPFRFQTKWYDKETEHYYFGYRYYSPRLGRWLSRDPLGEAGGINLYAYCGNDPVNRHDPLGLMTGPVHAELTAFSDILPFLASLGLTADQSSELMRGMVEGVLFPDLQVRIPTVRGGTPAQHIETVNRYMEFKNWAPEKVQEFGKWLDSSLDKVQRGTLDAIIPGKYAHTREGLENWATHTPSVMWNALDFYQKNFPDRPGSQLARDIYLSHMGSESWQHFMSSGPATAQDIQSKVVAATAENFGRFSAFRAGGDYHNAGFELGKSLHYLQDSYSTSHVHREGPFGPIKSIHDYSQQSTHKHAGADNPGRNSPSYRSALAQTKNLIRLYLSGRGTAADFAPFYQMVSGAASGIAGEEYGLPANTIFPFGR